MFVVNIVPCSMAKHTTNILQLNILYRVKSSKITRNEWDDSDEMWWDDHINDDHAKVAGSW